MTTSLFKRIAAPGAHAAALMLLLGTSGCLRPDEGTPANTGEDRAAVVLGTTESDFNFPWVVNVGVGCHGVLISPYWVLTAAHCIENPSIGMTIKYSRVDPAGGIHAQQKQSGPGSIFVHPAWPGSTDFTDDIALIRIPRFVADPYLVPMPFAQDPPTLGQPGVVASTLRQNHSIPQGTMAVLRGPVVIEGQLAFEAKSPTASLCPGDSGSGFITVENGRNVVAGIISNVPKASSVTCDQPNVEFESVTVAGHLSWIESTTHLHVLDRSSELPLAATAASPTTPLYLPGLRTTNIAYRDGSGHLWELWHDGAGFGQIGFTDLTANAALPVRRARRSRISIRSPTRRSWCSGAAIRRCTS